MGKNATLFLISIIIAIGIYSSSPTASAFVDSTFGSEVEPIEYNCFNGEDDDSDGYTDFDDSDC
jgi:hypothetical protein